MSDISPDTITALAWFAFLMLSGFGVVILCANSSFDIRVGKSPKALDRAAVNLWKTKTTTTTTKPKEETK